MFGLLKNKISSFINNLTQKKSEEEQPAPVEKTERSAIPAEKPLPKLEQIEKPEPKQSLPQKQQTERKLEQAKHEPLEKPKRTLQPERKQKPTPKQQIDEKLTSTPQLERKQPLEPKQQAEQKPSQPSQKQKEPTPSIEEKKQENREEGKSLLTKVGELVTKPVGLFKGEPPEKRELEARLSLESKVRSIFSNEVEIRDKDVRELLDNLEFSLLEADVAFEVSQILVEDLRKRLVGKRVPKSNLNDEIKNSVKESIVSVLEVEKPDFWRVVRERQKPVKILFVGPNGAGKTTTMSKLASILISKKYSCLFSASDTFRAAAIEQTIHHAEKLGINVVKHKYGADPAAVAFDAVNHAKANKIDVVLIDTAGRQDTNANLIDELRKINRVIRPDLKIFVGESIAGNAIIDQVRTFNDAIGLDAVILTKLDCDAKGGTALSISKATSVPILFIGVGQDYGDLIEFNARSIAEQMLT